MCIMPAIYTHRRQAMRTNVVVDDDLILTEVLQGFQNDIRLIS